MAVLDALSRETIEGLVIFLVIVAVAIVAVLLVVGLIYLINRFPPFPSSPDPPTCHRCGTFLKPVTARMLAGQVQNWPRGTPEAAAWYCDKHPATGLLYYAAIPEPPCVTKPGAVEPIDVGDF